MAKSSLPSLMSFVAVLLFILACSSIQINIQINTNLTATSGADAFQEIPTQTAFLSPPSVTSVPLTVTFTPTPEPMPHLALGQSMQISDLIMLSGTTGWGFEPGGHVLHTWNGGKTWRDVTPPQISYYNKKTFFTSDPNIAWAASVNSAEIKPWQTSNAGNSWEAGETIHLESIQAGECGPLHMENPFVNQLYFIDSLKGWMVVTASAREHGYTVSMLFASVDAGAHWSLKNLATRDCSSSDNPDGLLSVLFWTPNDGWGGFFQNKFGYYPYNQERYVGGWDIYRTSNTGETWESVTLPEPPGFLEEAAKNPDENATCGIIQFTPYSYAVFGMQMRCFIPNTAFYYYYLTFNNGTDWNIGKAAETEEFVVDVYADNRTTGWRFVPSTSKGLSQIQRTSDRGMTWVTIKKVAWQSARFDFVDEQVGWAMMTNGTNTLLLKTADGGRTWAPLAPLIE
jgi:hypothetical protein